MCTKRGSIEGIHVERIAILCTTILLLLCRLLQLVLPVVGQHVRILEVEACRLQVDLLVVMVAIRTTVLLLLLLRQLLWLARVGRHVGLRGLRLVMVVLVLVLVL